MAHAALGPVPRRAGVASVSCRGPASHVALGCEPSLLRPGRPGIARRAQVRALPLRGPAGLASHGALGPLQASRGRGGRDFV